MLVPAEHYDPWVNEVVYTTKGWLERDENRATAVTVMKAIITAGRKANADFGYYRDAFLEYATIKGKDTMPEEKMRSYYQTIAHDMGVWPADNAFRAANIEALMPFYKAAGALEDKPVDLASVVDESIVEQAVAEPRRMRMSREATAAPSRSRRPSVSIRAKRLDTASGSTSDRSAVAVRISSNAGGETRKPNADITPACAGYRTWRMPSAAADVDSSTELSASGFNPGSVVTSPSGSMMRHRRGVPRRFAHPCALRRNRPNRVRSLATPEPVGFRVAGFISA